MLCSNFEKSFEKVAHSLKGKVKFGFIDDRVEENFFLLDKYKVTGIPNLLVFPAEDKDKWY